MATKRRTIDRWAPWMFLGVLLLSWELSVRIFKIDQFVLPSATASFMALYDNFGAIMYNTWPTFWTTMVGFGMGIVVGVALGVIIGSSRFMYNGLYPLLVAFNAAIRVPGLARGSLPRHQAILDAIRRRQPNRARTAMRLLVQNTGRAIGRLDR